VGDINLHIKGRILNTSRYPVGLGAMVSVYLPISAWAQSGDDAAHKNFLAEPNVTLLPRIILDKEWGRSRRVRTALNVGALVRFGDDTFTDFGKRDVAN